MVEKNCYHCHSDRHTLFAEENGYSLHKCQNCGLLFVANPPSTEQISEAAKQGRHSGNRQLEVTGKFKSRKIARYLEVLRDLYGEEIPIAGNWLDVGCGHGEFLLAVKRFSNARIAVKGSEPNLEKQESARSRGLDVGFFDLGEHTDRYDAASLLNVYSHLPDPCALMRNIATILNPGGELVLETGDTKDLSASELPRPLYLPDHLFFATEKIVLEQLTAAGFEVIKVVKYPLIRVSGSTYLKEIAKIFLPGRASKIRHLVSNSLTEIDMFVRARKR